MYCLYMYCFHPFIQNRKSCSASAHPSFQERDGRDSITQLNGKDVRIYYIRFSLRKGFYAGARQKTGRGLWEPPQKIFIIYTLNNTLHDLECELSNQTLSSGRKARLWCPRKFFIMSWWLPLDGVPAPPPRNPSTGSAPLCNDR
jgi:hypothetical protein